MPERTLTVRIIGDDKSLHQAFARSEKAGKGLQVGVAGLGAGIARDLVPAAAAVFSVQKAFGFLGDSVEQASSLNEEVSKSKRIFGDSAATILNWSTTTASAIGVSQVAALEATGIFGNLFRTVGLAPAASAEMSQSLVKLAADLASFNNASPADVLEALRSGLIGEAEPLRRYGVLLSETRVQQQAMADTGKTNVRELTNQEKALARYEIILRDTKIAQDDFNKTSGGLANQQRVLAANMQDLKAEIGKGLLPAILHLTIAANDAFIALDKLGHVDLPFGGPSVGKILGLAGWTELNFLIDQVDKGLRKTKGSAIDLSNVLNNPAFLPGDPLAPNLFPTPAPPPKAPSAPDPFGPLKAQDAERRRQALAAQRAHRRAQSDFDAFVKGMGLKIDNAALTATFSDDLGALRQLEAAILARIRVEGRTFDLAQQLVDVRSRIASTLADQASASAERVAGLFDALSLKLDIAKTTRTFNDDLKVLRQVEQLILAQIRAEGRTTDLLRQLFENRQQQAQTLTAQRNAAQFEALGLTATGDERVAGRKALLRRATSLQEQIKGTILDTPKTRSQLRRIVNVLRSATKGVGRDVRASILSMLNDISSALTGSSAQQGPLTKFAKRGVESLIRGLGLTEEQTKELRQRFSQFNRFDAPGARAPGRTVSTRGTGRATGPLPSDQPITVNVYVDGQLVEQTVTRRQQKKRGRNAPSRRGVRPGV